MTSSDVPNFDRSIGHLNGSSLSTLYWESMGARHFVNEAAHSYIIKNHLRLVTAKIKSSIKLMLTQKLFNQTPKTKCK